MNQIEAMQYAGELAKSVFRTVQHMLEPGITTQYLNERIETTIGKHCRSAVLNYGPKENPFPAFSCISINEEVAHGIPSDQRVVKGGDLVSVDLGLQFEGYVIDTCKTFGVGEISKEADLLNYWTKTALHRAIRHIKAGICWQEVARIIENTARKHGFSVIKSLAGHGVGSRLHEEPILRNYVCAANELIKLEAGQTLAIEPMFAMGRDETETAEDGWTILTKDRSWVSHWEHTVLVTENGCQMLSKH